MMNKLMDLIRNNQVAICLVLFFFSATLVFLDMFQINAIRADIAANGFNCTKYYSMQMCENENMEPACIPKIQKMSPNMTINIE